MDNFTAFDMAVLGVMLVLLISLNGAWFIVNKIKKLVKQAELENNELKLENAKLRKRVNDLTPKPQGQSLVQENTHAAELSARSMMNPPPPMGMGMMNRMPENMVPQDPRMFEGIPPSQRPRVKEYKHTPLPSSSRVRDVHHHHHNTNDNFVTGVMVGSMLSSDDTPSRSAPVCAPSRDSDYSSPSDSGDSGSPSCD